MIIYLSGPITGSSDFVAVFDRVRRELEAGGEHRVINPAVLAGVATEGVLSYEDYMAIDQTLLSKAQVLMLLPGWQDSPGCNRELGYAEALGLMIFEYDENGGHFGPFKGWRPTDDRAG